jgi:hypothetical protein
VARTGTIPPLYDRAITHPLQVTVTVLASPFDLPLVGPTLCLVFKLNLVQDDRWLS